MDEKSTPIESLNNQKDDSQVVNQILNKYNSLEQNPEGTLPPQDKNIPEMENKFENRDLNNQMFEMQSDNTQFKDHSLKEQARVQQYNQPQGDDESAFEEDDEYDEYEVEEIPLWKRIVNEIRVPLLIFLMILVFMSQTNDKLLIKKMPFLGDQFNEINTTGFLIKAFLCSMIAYVLVRFIRV